MEVQAWKKGGSLTAPPETVAGGWESRKAKAYLRVPWHAPPKVTIQEEDKAIILHDSATDDIRIYTDGSGQNGQIGAGMVIPEMRMTRKAYLGTTKTSIYI